MKHSTRGFTIVELLIVIVVIAILAAITIVAYTGIQTRANDTRMASGINQFEKALRIWSNDHPAPIKGGSGSTVAASGGECSNGSSGFVPTSTYTCSVDDALVQAGNLPAGFLTNLPKNNYYSNPSNGRLSVMLYVCQYTDRYALYWTLQNPSTSDTNGLNSTMSACGHGTSLRDTYGMRAGRILQF